MYQAEGIFSAIRYCYGIRSAENCFVHCRTISPMAASKEKPGFTLIELLVVIAIISLLVSILLPSLKKAKELADQTVCKSKLKNIGVASMLYTEDNDGWLLPGMVNSTVWFYQMTTPSYGLRWPESFTCPAETVPVGRMYVADDVGKYQYTHYGSNTYLTGIFNADGTLTFPNLPELQIPHKLESVRQPSRVIYFGDSSRTNSYSMLYAVFVGFRHPNAEANFLYVDGHVEGWEYAEFNPSPNKLRIGFDYPGYEDY